MSLYLYVSIFYAFLVTIHLGLTTRFKLGRNFFSKNQIFFKVASIVLFLLMNWHWRYVGGDWENYLNYSNFTDVRDANDLSIILFSKEPIFNLLFWLGGYVYPDKSSLDGFFLIRLFILGFLLIRLAKLGNSFFCGLLLLLPIVGVIGVMGYPKFGLSLIFLGISCTFLIEKRNFLGYLFFVFAVLSHLINLVFCIGLVIFLAYELRIFRFFLGIILVIVSSWIYFDPYSFIGRLHAAVFDKIYSFSVFYDFSLGAFSRLFLVMLPVFLFVKFLICFGKERRKGHSYILIWSVSAACGLGLVFLPLISVISDRIALACLTVIGCMTALPVLDWNKFRIIVIAVGHFVVWNVWWFFGTFSYLWRI